MCIDLDKINVVSWDTLSLYTEGSTVILSNTNGPSEKSSTTILLFNDGQTVWYRSIVIGM